MTRQLICAVWTFAQSGYGVASLLRREIGEVAWWSHMYGSVSCHAYRRLV